MLDLKIAFWVIVHFALLKKLTTINYDGTQAQWNAITRDVSDGINAGVKVVCTDGTITIS